MKYTDKNEREVDITATRFEHGEGAYVVSAYYLDDDSECSDDVLDYLTDAYQMQLYEDAWSSAASAAYDRAKDRMKYGD